MDGKSKLPTDYDLAWYHQENTDKDEPVSDICRKLLGFRSHILWTTTTLSTPLKHVEARVAEFKTILPSASESHVKCFESSGTYKH